MTRRARNNQKGFTLIELLLALAFLAFVLLFIVIAIVQVMRTYNKGLAVKTINQTARATVEDMSRIVAASDINAINTTALGSGRLCFGGVSYVWNIEDATTNKFAGVGQPALTFVRVNDAAGAMCTSTAGIYPNVDPTQATALIDGSIWVEKIGVTKTLASSLVDLDLQFATIDDHSSPSLIYTPSAPQVATCKGGTQGQFCAVARFTTTVAATGGQ